jgi:hypothetical protein
VIVKANALYLPKAWLRRLRGHSAKKPVVRVIGRALAAAIFVLLMVPDSEEPLSAVTVRARRAQELVNEFRSQLSITPGIRIALVAHHPLVFSVEPADATKTRFVLSMEIGFLLMLDEDEMSAALAHELGHVWIFTHHPFLHTERLANNIGQRVVKRHSFEKLYQKLWAYEGTSGVAMEQLLGPRPVNESGPQTFPSAAADTAPVEGAAQ